MTNVNRQKWRLVLVLIVGLVGLGLAGLGSRVTHQQRVWARSEMAAEAAVEPLASSLLHGDSAEISMAARELGRMGSPAAVDALLVPLADRELTSSRHAAMAALEEMGAPAIGPLVGLLDNEDATTRRNAAEMLGWIGSPSATPWLVPLLADESAEVRNKADWALRAIADGAVLKARSPIEPRS
jgi:HEAT repeat protein